jgi:hypothetical protein
MSPLHRPRKRTALGGMALLLALTGSAVAVGGTMGSAPARADEILPSFDDCDALTARMRDLTLPYVGDYGFNGSSMNTPDTAVDAPAATGPMPAADAAASAGAPAAAPAAGGDALSGQGLGKSAPQRRDAYSSPDQAVGPGGTGTNLQEAGVDEPDIAKTDGRLVVSVDGGSLRIMDVSTDSPRSRGSLDLTNLGLSPSELLLDGDRVLVIGTTTRDTTRYGGHEGDVYMDDARSSSYRGDSAALGLVDLRDPDKPRLLATEEITGRHVSARLSGGVARVVVSSTPDLPFLAPGANLSSRETARNYNRDVVRFAKAADWLPSRTVVDGDGHILSPAAPLVDCADVRYPAQDSGTDMLAVVTVDLGRDDAFAAAGSTAVVATGDLVYASPQRLYIATTQGGWGPSRGFAPSDSGGATAIHEFDISEPGSTHYLSSGRVEGYVPGRWALSEYAGYLRVVTTTQEPWRSGGGTESSVVVLRPRHGRLVEVGRVGGIGNGETVRAVRWFDELAAVVTFRQTDPLYLVDMGEPARPLVRGRLKVPGYSAYLHPIGDHRLLGVGQDGTASGQETGLQISSFDIADAADPRRVDAVGYGPGSRSVVQDDARGFVYLPERRTAVLPAEMPFDQAVCAFECYRGSAGGLVSVHVAKNGRLTKGGTWRVRSAGDGQVTKVLSLPGGRLAALDGNGVTVLDADTLAGRGSAGFSGR